MAIKQKPVFCEHMGFNYVVSVESLNSNEFFMDSFGRQLDDLKKLKLWKETAKLGWVGSKGKPTMKSVKKWIKENQPIEFYARWEADCQFHKDDVVEIFYK